MWFNYLSKPSQEISQQYKQQATRAVQGVNVYF